MKPTHEDKFSNNEELNRALKYWRGYEKKKVYAWVKSDGTLLSECSDSKESLLSHKEAMESYATEHDVAVRLLEFRLSDTHCLLLPPPPPEDEFVRGGCAIGGRVVSSVEYALEEMWRIFSKHYPTPQDVAFWIEENTVFAEHKNVRCWVAKLDAESSLEKKWRVYVTMIKNWNDEYHDVHVGDFVHGCEAIEEAFIAFTRYQIAEQTIDDFF